MTNTLRKIIIAVVLNSALFSMLIIGIQNSSSRNKVNFLNNESVNLPISFIIGFSFISGSIIGSFLNLNNARKK